MNIRAAVRTAASTLAVGAVAAGISACAGLAPQAPPSEQATLTVSLAQDSHTAPASPAPDALGPGDDYAVVTGKAVVEHAGLTPGQTGYCALDGRQRATCAYGLLTQKNRARAKAAGRQEITVDPAGWPAKNPIVTIPARPGVTGSKQYRGYALNRSHLLADSLGGDAVAANLVTGTRTQNVGSTQARGQAYGGMARGELDAREYLDAVDGRARNCPLYYAARAVYQGNELVPRTVVVDLRSCDGRAVDRRIVVYNQAQGLSLDYRNGAVAVR